MYCQHCGINLNSSGLTGPKMASQIEARIRRLFPNSFLKVEFAHVSDQNYKSIFITFAFGKDESKWNMRNIFNDPYHMQIWIRGMHSDGTLDAKQIVDATTNNARRIAPFEPKVAPAKQIIDHVVQHFSDLKKHIWG